MRKSKEEKAHTAKRQQIAKTLLSISLMVKNQRSIIPDTNALLKRGRGGEEAGLLRGAA